MTATSTSLALPTVAPSRYRDAINHHAAGVGIVTAVQDGQAVGLGVVGGAPDPPTARWRPSPATG